MSVLRVFERIYVRQLIGMDRKFRWFFLATIARFPGIEEMTDFTGIELLGAILRRRAAVVGAEAHAELETRNGKLIVGQQRGPPHALAIDSRPIGAAQVAEQQ